MVSETQQTKRRRHNRDQKKGRTRKRLFARVGSPSFPLDPPGRQSTETQSTVEPSTGE